MRTQEAFTISILDCAYKIGLKFSHTYVNSENQTEYVFHNPLRKDSNASLYINPTKNVAYDNGGIIGGGGIVWFINYLYGNNLTDTKSALKVLDTIYPELKHPSKRAGQTRGVKHISQALPLFSRHTQKNEPAPAGSYNKKEKELVFELVQVKELFSYPLKNYLKDDRKIDINIAKLHVKEIIYKHIEKNNEFYGIGFRSGETWVIRRKQFKGFLGKGADITIIDNKTDNILIFEGFIDYLSYLTAKRIKQPQSSVIVLNSAVFVNRAIEFVKEHGNIKSVDYFRDRDDTGKQSLKRLEKALNDVIIRDKSEVYPNHKDLNEWLIHEHSRT